MENTQYMRHTTRGCVKVTDGVLVQYSHMQWGSSVQPRLYKYYTLKFPPQMDAIEKRCFLEHIWHHYEANL